MTTLLINCNPSVVSIPCHNKSSCVRFPNLNVSQAMHNLELLLPKDPRIELGPKNTIITASSIKKTKKYILYWNIHWISSNESKQRTLKCFYFSKQCDLYVHCMKRNSLPYNDLPIPPTLICLTYLYSFSPFYGGVRWFIYQSIQILCEVHILGCMMYTVYTGCFFSLGLWASP